MDHSDSDAVSSEDDEDSDDFDSMESDEGEVGSLTGGALRRWMRALEAVVSEDDDAFSETEDDAAAGDSDSDDAPRNTSLSDCFEKRSKNLAALPTNNDEKWPQENTHYYRRKKKTEYYVRTDKYTLRCIYRLCKKLPTEAKLPSILSVYGSRS